MIPNSFAETIKLIHAYDNDIEAEFGDFSLISDYDWIRSEYLKNPATGNTWLEDISAMYDHEYAKFSKAGIYFFGCPIDIYKNTQNERLDSYKKINTEANELTFLESELKLICTCEVDNRISNNTRKIIELSLRRQKDFLESEVRDLGYKVVYDPNYLLNPKASFVLRLEKENTKLTSIEDKIEQLKVTEKVIYLHELGILDFLRSKAPFNTSNNKLAETLSKILDVKQETLQSNLNPIFSTDASQKNNPLTRGDSVLKVQTYLAGIGFKTQKR